MFCPLQSPPGCFLKRKDNLSVSLRDSSLIYHVLCPAPICHSQSNQGHSKKIMTEALSLRHSLPWNLAVFYFPSSTIKKATKMKKKLPSKCLGLPHTALSMNSTFHASHSCLRPRSRNDTFQSYYKIPLILLGQQILRLFLGDYESDLALVIFTCTHQM